MNRRQDRRGLERARAPRLAIAGLAIAALLSALAPSVRAADVELLTEALTPGAGGTFQVEVVVDAGGTVLGGYHLRLGYDPTTYTIVAVW